jgi:hypothetical protein
MAETITDRIFDAIATPERRTWMDPADAREIAEDVARALGHEPEDVVEVGDSGKHHEDG